MTFPFPSHYLPPQNSGPCNSFHCLGHFRNVYDDDDDDDDDDISLYLICWLRAVNVRAEMDMGWVGLGRIFQHMWWVGWVGLNEKYCGIVAEYCKTDTHTKFALNFYI